MALYESSERTISFRSPFLFPARRPPTVETELSLETTIGLVDQALKSISDHGSVLVCALTEITDRKMRLLVAEHSLSCTRTASKLTSLTTLLITLVTARFSLISADVRIPLIFLLILLPLLWTSRSY